MQSLSTLSSRPRTVSPSGSRGSCSSSDGGSTPASQVALEHSYSLPPASASDKSSIPAPREPEKRKRDDTNAFAHDHGYTTAESTHSSSSGTICQHYNNNKMIVVLNTKTVFLKSPFTLNFKTLYLEFLRSFINYLILSLSLSFLQYKRPLSQ